MVRGRSDELGNWLWPEEQARGLHSSYRAPQLDSQQNGGELASGLSSSGKVPVSAPCVQANAAVTLARAEAFQMAPKQT